MRAKLGKYGHWGLVPPTVEVPPVCSRVAVQPHHSSIIDDTSVILARVPITPPLTRHPIGPCSREHGVPRAAVAIRSRYDVIAPLLDAGLDRARGGEQVQRQSGIGGCPEGARESGRATTDASASANVSSTDRSSTAVAPLLIVVFSTLGSDLDSGGEASGTGGAVRASRP